MKTEDLMRELLYGYKPPFDETNNIESENTENERRRDSYISIFELSRLGFEGTFSTPKKEA